MTDPTPEQHPTAGQHPAAEHQRPDSPRHLSRQQQQIKLILDADPSMAAGPKDGDGGVTEYLYRKGSVLVRSQYVDQVRRLASTEVTGETAGVMRGIERMGVRDTMAAMRVIINACGPGVASPDHAVSITPGDCGCCPATEPEPVAANRLTRPALETDPAIGAGVRVVVIDTGLDPRSVDKHPWLTGVTGDDDPGATGPGSPLETYAGHGTFIAGVVRSVAPGAEVIVRRGFRPKGVVYETDLIKTLIEVLQNDHPDVISLSAGTWAYDPTGLISFDAFYETYLSAHKGVVLVAAAGNNGDRKPFWPAAYPWAVSVGALDVNWGQRALFSDFGGWVDVYAPGEDIINAFPEGIYTYEEEDNTGRQATFTGLARWSGTSFSTPMVAGLIAARMARTGENGLTAAAALLTQARAAHQPGVGPILLPPVA